tara:strand:- start:2030 stop:4825 length:2796 start_codon:yes stop_codon:yes gene_type:complete
MSDNADWDVLPPSDGTVDDPYFDPALGDTDPLNEHKGVGGGQGDNSYTSVGVDPSTLWDPTKGLDFGKVGQYLKKLLTGEGSAADYGTGLAGLMGLYEYMNRDRSPRSWEGKVTKTPYSGNTVSSNYYPSIMSRGYGERAMGMNPFTGGTYAPPASGGGGTPPAVIDEGMERFPIVSDGRKIDVPVPDFDHNAPVSLIDPRESAGFARGGSAEPRYLRGETDGMADELNTSIDDQQPAKLSHGEFVVPADVVSHLGNGNSDAGAKVLYKMMDRVRHARTGTKEQGREINPDKFTPGGMAYAGGGAVAFQTGGAAGGASGAAPSSGGTSAGGLAPWVGDYVAGPEGFLSKAWGLASQPYQAYQGPLTAGMSPLQNQAAMGFSGLQTPYSIYNAANTAGNIATQLQNMPGYQPQYFGNQFMSPGAYQTGSFAPNFSYSPTSPIQFGNQFSAPSPYQAEQFSSGFQAPTIGPDTQFASQFNAPQAYQPTNLTQGIGGLSYDAGQFSSGFNYQPTEISTGLGPVGSVQSYMSPYQSAVSDIEAREATRQADIASTARGAKFAQAGAFGGARQAIENAEAQRNLSTQIGDIRSKGLQSAYDRALAQRAQEAQMGMTAQQATEAGRQFGAERGAQFGLQGQQMGEQSRQFGSQFGMQGLGQLLEARKAQESAQQFASQQGMTAAQLQAQYGLTAQQAQEASRQFNAGQRMTSAQLQSQFGLDAQKASELSRQFGAQQGMTASQLQAQYGLSAQQAQEAARQFNAGQTLTAAQLQSQFGLDAQKAAEMSRQFGAQQAMTGAQTSAQYGLAGLQAGETSRQFAANYGLNALQQALAAAQAQGNLGQLGLTSDIARLNALMGAGNVQQSAEQAAVDAQIKQFQEAQMWPYKQLEFQRSLLSGLPVGTSTVTPTSSGFSDLIGGIGGLLGLNKDIRGATGG